MPRSKDIAVDLGHGWKNKRRVSQEALNAQHNTKPRRGFTQVFGAFRARHMSAAEGEYGNVKDLVTSYDMKPTNVKYDGHFS